MKQRAVLALCAATALVVLLGSQVARAHSVSERRAPSTRASAGGGPFELPGALELATLSQPDRRWRLPGKEGAGRRAAARSAASTAPGEAQRQGTTLEWNRLGRLVRTIQGGVTTTYGHDSYFRRAVQQRTGSPLELYVYEGANIAAVASAAGVAGVERRFLWDGVDHPLWMFDKATDAGVYFELDCIGNVRRLRGGARYGAGAALPSDLGGYKYSAFGRSIVADAGTPAPVVDGVGFEQPLRWQGRWLDTATGIYDVRNRQWSPELGAFLSPDEFVFHAAKGTLWSWPAQNPLRHRDRTGRFGDETVVLAHHPEPVPAGLPPGPPSGVFVGVAGGATFTGAVSVGAGQFFGAATPDATYRSIGIGVGFLPAAGAGIQAGWFAGTAEEFGRAQTLFVGVGSGVGIEGALIFGPDGSFGASLTPQLVWGSPLWWGTILGGEASVVCE